MKGFFKEKEVKNQEADEPWKKSERDIVLDEYCAGRAHPRELAQRLGRNPKAIKRLIEQFTNNERDRVIRYESFRRTSRKGKKFTQNELRVVKAHQAKGVPAEATARLLCRGIDELVGKKGLEGATQAKSDGPLAPTLDLIWAHRYIFFVYKSPILSDAAYNALVEEEIEYGGGEKAFQKIKVLQGWPEHIKCLAMYLTLRKDYKG